MTAIIHITQRDEWEKASESGSYNADTLKTQGFIHCSSFEQVISVANFFFKGQNNLVLLIIDTTKISAEIKYENL